MKIQRVLKATIIDKIKYSNKGVIVYGARQTGKTTLINEVVKELDLRTFIINGDQSQYTDIVSSRNLSKIKQLLSGYQLLFVDEAQRIAEIGINLKIILDSMPEVKVIATGSSALDLASKISEPLTGRVNTYKLYPIATEELAGVFNRAEIDEKLEDRLVFGSYPEIFAYESRVKKAEYLRNLSDAYLYKDLLEFGGLKNSTKIRDLLKLLAFQTGSLVSLTELASSLDMGKETVAKYIDYLEKSFVVFRLAGFSRNLRKEITKMDKIYFYDLGIRNILIDNLKPLKDRNDSGQLWENFLIGERMKKQGYGLKFYSQYFWRTYTGAEIDYVEEAGGKLAGFEFKFSTKKVRVPKTWLKTYENALFKTINKNNWQEFVS